MRGVQHRNNTNSSLAKIGAALLPQGNPIGVSPEVPILVTRNDCRLAKLKRNLVVQDNVDTDGKVPQPPQPPTRSPSRPSTLSSTSTNLQTLMTGTSRDPFSPEPEDLLHHCCYWSITRNFTDKKKMPKKVVTSLFEEVEALTEAFVAKYMKSPVPGEATRAVSKEEVAYKDALVVKFRESLKKF
ncbi:hypothetical protein O181_057395 [Austropuccinia psidii MF-1]|uniref:Uncharacterized protein n=1 Tax=Austropuccinia psidii MF-1 TaxID=1389203 RepID=A0A9Q3E7V1_9BASI|nr:hypothetical protein [Austropuccinia psidii MF-1]